MEGRVGGMLVLLCFFFCVHHSHSLTPSVPLLMWRNNEDLGGNPPVVTYGKTKTFSDIYNEQIEPVLEKKSMVLLFLQDELSKDDFTKYSSSFPHLKKVLDEKSYFLYPSVSKFDDMVPRLEEKSEIHLSSELSNWKLDEKHKNDPKLLKIFYLEPLLGSHSKGKADIFSRNDKKMQNVIDSMKESGKDFYVVYSAVEPSQMVSNFLTNEENNIEGTTFGGRHLLADAKSNITQNLFNNSCVLMHVTSITYKTDVINATEFVSGDLGKWKVGGCGSHNLGCSISAEKTGAFGKFMNATLLIEFKNDTQQWYCDVLRFSGQYNGKAFYSEFSCGGMNGSTEFQSSGVYNTIAAPIGMSYACHEMIFVSGNSKNKEVLKLGGFQVQTFCDGRGVTPKRFSSAFSCVGFFTIEILTGIMVTIILGIGLYIGIMMMMAIQVQDRFDDPKGKTISIAAVHNE